MNDPAVADRFLSAMRSYDPAHPFVHQRLANHYADVGAWDSQRESLERALARAERDSDRHAIHVALGELYEEHIPNAKLATRHYEAALRLEPRSMPALAGLERLFRTGEQYARLLEVLDRQVDAAISEAESGRRAPASRRARRAALRQAERRRGQVRGGAGPRRGQPASARRSRALLARAARVGEARRGPGTESRGHQGLHERPSGSSSASPR